jgi:3-hydroxyacyl-[acyl-carrier-protein] dehydratase
MASELGLPIAIEEFVPHRGPMMLLDELIECGDDCAEAGACFSADSPFVASSGQVHELALVELIAQTYAAMRGYEAAVAQEPPTVGFLVGVSKTTVCGSLRAGEACRVRVRTKGVFATFAVADGDVRLGDEVILRGIIKIYELPRSGDSAPE